MNTLQVFVASLPCLYFQRRDRTTHNWYTMKEDSVSVKIYSRSSNHGLDLCCVLGKELGEVRTGFHPHGGACRLTWVITIIKSIGSFLYSPSYASLY